MSQNSDLVRIIYLITVLHYTHTKILKWEPASCDLRAGKLRVTSQTGCELRVCEFVAGVLRCVPDNLLHYLYIDVYTMFQSANKTK